MFFRVSKIAMLLFMIFSFSSIAQSKDDAQKQREAYEKKAQEELDERIQTFISDLNADDFQKEIIKQKLDSYFEEKKAIYMNNSLKYYERDEQLLTLDNSHFTDIKEMVSDDTMKQIQLFIKDAGTTLNKQKKKNKKRKNKKKE
ncbi:MAG: hypothetical protein R2783_02240 [Gelidibacter sp.]